MKSERRHTTNTNNKSKYQNNSQTSLFSICFFAFIIFLIKIVGAIRNLRLSQLNVKKQVRHYQMSKKLIGIPMICISMTLLSI